MSNFNVTEFAKDVTLSADFVEIESASKPLAEGISDTLMAVGTEAMKQANQVYALIKVAAKSDGNMNALAKQLGERYKKTSKNGGSGPPPPPAV